MQRALLAEQLNALLKEGGAEDQGQNDADATLRRQPAVQALHQQGGQHRKEQAGHDDRHPPGTEQCVEEPGGDG